MKCTSRVVVTVLVTASMFVAGAHAATAAGSTAAGANAPLPAPPHTQFAFTCDGAAGLARVAVYDPAGLASETFVPGCLPRRDAAHPDTVLVPAETLRRLVLAAGPLQAAAGTANAHAAVNRWLAALLGPDGALAANGIVSAVVHDPAQMIALSTTTTINWCGSHVTDDRTDCIGDCTCGPNGSGCPCSGTKTTIVAGTGTIETTSTSTHDTP